MPEKRIQPTARAIFESARRIVNSWGPGNEFSEQQFVDAINYAQSEIAKHTMATRRIDQSFGLDPATDIQGQRLVRPGQSVMKVLEISIFYKTGSEPEG